LLLSHLRRPATATPLPCPRPQRHTRAPPNDPRAHASPRAVIVSQNEVVTAADDIDGDSQVMNDWDDDYDEEDRAFSGGKKKKKSKKSKKHQIADYD